MFLPPVIPSVSLILDAANNTTGTCSPIVNSNRGSVVIKCEHLDPAVAARLGELARDLNQLNAQAAKKRDTDLILKTLRNMQEIARQATKDASLTINAPVNQSSTGDCSPNIVGVNVTNNCGNRLQISAEQEAKLTTLLRSSRASRYGITVQLLYESAPEPNEAAHALARAMDAAGVQVQIGFPDLILGTQHGDVPGISVGSVSTGTKVFAALLAQDLLRAGIVSKAPLVDAPDPGVAPNVLTIYVKKP